MKYSTKDLYLARLGKIYDVKYISYDVSRTSYEKLNNYVFVRYDGWDYHDIFTFTKYKTLKNGIKGEVVLCETTPVAINRKKVSKKVLEKIIEELNPNVLIVKENPLEEIKQRLLKK